MITKYSHSLVYMYLNTVYDYDMYCKFPNLKLYIEKIRYCKMKTKPSISQLAQIIPVPWVGLFDKSTPDTQLSSDVVIHQPINLCSHISALVLFCI